MKTLPKVMSGGLLFVCAAILLPTSAAAQAVLSVNPTSVNVQTNVGTNAASQTVQVRKSGAGALRWTVVPPAAAWLTVSPTSGTNNVTLTLTFQTSNLAAQAQPYTTSFSVVSGTQSVTVNVGVTIVGSVPKLIVTCPSNISVASPNGSAVNVTYSASTSGGTPPVNVTYSPPSGTSFSVGTTTVRVDAQSSDLQTASCMFTVTVTYTPGQLTVTCPANISVASPDGSAVAVTYTATTSGGTAPVTVTYSPSSGSNFPVGTTSVQVTAQSSDSQTASCTFSVTVTYSPDPSPLWTLCAYEGQFCAFSGTRQVRYGVNDTYFYKTLTNGTPCTNDVFGDPVFGATKHCDYSAPVTSTIGPTTAITCPAGAISIFPGTSIQATVNNNPINTTFCLRSGNPHFLTSPITPKGGDAFIGEYGAIVDGTGWATNNDFDAAFRALDQDIDNVTIENLVIRNFRRGIHAGWPSTLPGGWIIENNDIGPNYSGVLFPGGSTIRNNYIHDNNLFGYAGNTAHNSLLENNEIARNGTEQKIALSNNVTFRNNFVHHNSGAGIWYDSDNTGGIVEGNRVEDNGWIGIFYEVSTDGIIRNNTVRRSGDAAVFLSTSKNTQVYSNTLENNFRGITYFLNCNAVGGGSIGWDLTNNTSHDNIITVDTTSGALATVFSYISECTSTYVEPYRNGSKGLTFSNNTYDVPSPTTGQYWYWAPTLYNWSGWQTLGFDKTGTVK